VGPKLKTEQKFKTAFVSAANGRSAKAPIKESRECIQGAWRKDRRLYFSFGDPVQVSLNHRASCCTQPLHTAAH
jgi:hypothetical protein